MADNVLEDAGPAPDAGKVKRAPPTIELEATKLSEAASAEPKQAPTAAEPPSESPKQSSRPEGAPRASTSPWLIAPLSGVVAAALVIAAGWLAGWPSVQAPPAEPQASAAAVDELGKRVASLESKTAKAPAPVADPSVTARLDTMEKSFATLRGDLANLRTQADKLATAVNDAKSAPRDAGATPAAAPPAVDLSAINDRIDQIERTLRAQATAIAEAGAKPAPSVKAEDDLPLRRLIAAALLDVAVRHGDGYAKALATAKALSPNPDALKPLDAFAEKGVPNPPALCRELLTLVPKLTPAPDNSTTGSGVIDRLEASASKLVRVERTDAVGNDRSAIVARVTQAALRNELAETRRELGQLEAADRAPAQAWLDKAAARDAALAASRQFADDSMAALGKAAQ